MSEIATRKRRSEKLTPAERTLFKKWVNSFDTKRDALELFGYSHVTLDAVLLKDLVSLKR